MFSYGALGVGLQVLEGRVPSLVSDAFRPDPWRDLTEEGIESNGRAQLPLPIGLWETTTAGLWLEPARSC